MGSRSGYESAYWMGSSISGRPSWAMIAPSWNSTSEWMIDCGWIQTRSRSYGSMEKVVRLDHLKPFVHERRRVDGDFFPMAQVGWLSACAGVMRGESVGRQILNGPPDAVRMMLSTRRSLRRQRHWRMALCSLSTGTSEPLPRFEEGMEVVAADDQALFVGERDPFAALQRGHGRAQANGAHKRIEKEVDTRVRRPCVRCRFLR